MQAKSCSNSLAVKISHVLPPDTNALGTLFGGRLMAHVDDVAAIAAVRHARESVVTASTDSVDFLHPVKSGDSIRSEEHTSELQSRGHLVCRLLLEKKKQQNKTLDKTQ